MIANKKVVDAIADGSGAFLHGFTYNAHPISVAAGRAVLRYLKAHKLVEAGALTRPGSAATMVREALESLCEMNSVGDVRGIGCYLAIEFVADKRSEMTFSGGAEFFGPGCAGCRETRIDGVSDAGIDRRSVRRSHIVGAARRHFG